MARSHHRKGTVTVLRRWRVTGPAGKTVPHLLQNLASGGFSRPQAAQTLTLERPSQTADGFTDRRHTCLHLRRCIERQSFAVHSPDARAPRVSDQTIRLTDADDCGRGLIHTRDIAEGLFISEMIRRPVFPNRQNDCVDATTLLGLVGIAGTLLGAIAGAGGAIGSARVTRRGQADVEEQRARRQVYSACSTVLLARRDAASALLQAFFEDDFDATVAQTRMQELDGQRDAVARAVGAVAVEGPYSVMSSAEVAASAIEALASRLRDWVATVAARRDERSELVRSQGQYGREDERYVAELVDGFTEACRKVLHPAEIDRSRFRRRRLLRRR